MLKKIALTTVATLAISLQAQAGQSLSIKVYNAPESSFNVNSTLIMGEKEAVLLDTGFTRSDAYRIAANVLDSGKTLKTIVITQADPDYYFGAQVLHDIFPAAKIVSPEPVLAEIKHKFQGKLDFWGPKMGANAPQNPFLPQPMVDQVIDLEGKKIEVRGTTGVLANRPYVWIPSIQTIAGDVNTYAGMHVWTADSATPELRRAWLARLDEMKALRAKTLVPGHMVANTPLTPSAIDTTRAYLVKFEQVLLKNKKSGLLIDEMKKAYPKLEGISSLDLGAKVATGEMKW